MPFIEMTGKTLRHVVTEGELTEADLTKAGVDDDTIVRVNDQGDIEVRRIEGWDVVGGLLGDYAPRVEKETGLRWA